jgi:hypothetical protein
VESFPANTGAPRARRGPPRRSPIDAVGTRYSASVRGLAAVGLMTVAILLAAWDVGGVFLLVVAFGFGVAAIVVAGGDDGDEGEKKKEW